MGTTPKRRRARAPKVAVVVKQTTYRKFVVQEHDPLITKLLRKHDPTVKRLKSSDDSHQATIHEVEVALAQLGAETVFHGGPLAHIPAAVDLVITVGGDGTLLAASHQIGDGVPLLGINSAPETSIGFFCGAKKGSVFGAIEQALSGKLPSTELSRMRVDLNGKCLHARVLNEALFCHASPAATSRYILVITRANGTSVEEDQRSSGIWVGPAAGSTAAQRSAGGEVLPLPSKRIQYVVREPYTPAGGRLRFPRGLLEVSGSLKIRSKMREAKVFVDGHRVVHPVTIGDVLEMRRSDEQLTVLGITTKRRG